MIRTVLVTAYSSSGPELREVRNSKKVSFGIAGVSHRKKVSFNMAGMCCG
jgi:hypothetical protein